jgi:hypothetical protein
VPERVLLFCVASNTDRAKAGITGATAQVMLIKGLVERDHASSFRLTDQGRAVLSALLPRRGVILAVRILENSRRRCSNSVPNMIQCDG